MFGVSYYLIVLHIYQKSIVHYSQIFGLAFTMINLAVNIAVAILFGIYVALLFYKREFARSKSLADKASGIGGVTTAIIASGCPACGMPLLGFLGFPAIINYLPYRGIEIKVFSIILLLLAIYIVLKNIKDNMSCKVVQVL